MPALNNKSLLLEVAAFVADNNIRRGVLTMATNSMATDGTFNDRSLNVATGLQTPVEVAVVPDNKMTLLKTTGGPIRVTAKIGENLNAVEFDVASVWVQSTEVKELSLINAGTRAVQVRILQV